MAVYKEGWHQGKKEDETTISLKFKCSYKDVRELAAWGVKCRTVVENHSTMGLCTIYFSVPQFFQQFLKWHISLQTYVQSSLWLATWSTSLFLFCCQSEIGARRCCWLGNDRSILIWTTGPRSIERKYNCSSMLSWPVTPGLMATTHFHCFTRIPWVTSERPFRIVAKHNTFQLNSCCISNTLVTFLSSSTSHSSVVAGAVVYH